MRLRSWLPFAALAFCVIATNILITLPSLAAKAPRLQFSSAITPEHRAIKALMEKEGEIAIEDRFLEIAPIDLDLDGVPELMAFAINTDYFCGTAGCTPELYRSDGAGWQKLELGLDEFINSTPEDWSIAKERRNGHLVLVLTETHFVTHFAWDGQAYSSID